MCPDHASALVELSLEKEGPLIKSNPAELDKVGTIGTAQPDVAGRRGEVRGVQT